MSRHRPTKYTPKAALMKANDWKVINVMIPLAAPATQILGLSELGSLNACRTTGTATRTSQRMLRATAILPEPVARHATRAAIAVPRK